MFHGLLKRQIILLIGVILLLIIGPIVIDKSFSTYSFVFACVVSIIAITYGITIVYATRNRYTKLLQSKIHDIKEHDNLKDRKNQELISSFKKEIFDLKSDNKSLQSSLNQSINMISADKEEFKKEISDLQDKIAQYKKQCHYLEKKNSTLRTTFESINERNVLEHSSYSQKSKLIESKYERAQDRVISLQTKIQSYVKLATDILETIPQITDQLDKVTQKGNKSSIEISDKVRSILDQAQKHSHETHIMQNRFVGQSINTPTKTETNSSLNEITNNQNEYTNSPNNNTNTITNGNTVPLSYLIQDSLTLLKEMLQMVDSNNTLNEKYAATTQQILDYTAEINARSDEIRNISESSNVLALNAAIETAKVEGENGGLSVIADEIRKISDRTNVTYKSIVGMVDKVNDSVFEVNSSIQNSLSSMAQRKSSFNKAVDNIQSTVDDTLSDFSQIVKKNSVSSEEVTKNIDEIVTSMQFKDQNKMQIENILEHLYKLRQIAKDTLSFEGGVDNNSDNNIDNNDSDNNSGNNIRMNGYWWKY